jgi:hypothetical protein
LFNLSFTCSTNTYECPLSSGNGDGDNEPHKAGKDKTDHRLLALSTVLLSLASKLLVHTLASAAVHFFLIIHQSFLSMELGLGLG